MSRTTSMHRLDRYLNRPKSEAEFQERNARIYGAYMADLRTYTDIGDEHGLTHERVRTIVAKQGRKRLGSSEKFRAALEERHQRARNNRFR